MRTTTSRAYAPTATTRTASVRLVSRVAALATTAALTAALVACSPDGVDLGYEIESVACDPASSARGSATAFSPLGGDTYAVTGWSHTSAAETSLALDPSRYGLIRASYTPDPTCADQNTLEIVLVKRLVDWDRQHMNGIEAFLPRRAVLFSDVTDITLELRLLPELSAIPSPERLTTHFADVLDDEEVRELDTGKVNLELTLFGEKADAERPYLNAGTIIEIDPAEWADGWVRVTVPAETLDAYTEVAYQRTAAELGDYPELTVRGLRINPESASGRTLRHYQLDDFVLGATPELFKEMAMSIALIEVGHAPLEETRTTAG